MTAPVQLPASKPLGDMSNWSGLAAFLKSAGFRTVRELVDGGLPLTGAFPSWLNLASGAATYQTLNGPGYPGGGYTITTDGTNGGTAGMKMYNPQGAASQVITPNYFGALALTLEGLQFSDGNANGFDFQMGFPGSSSTVGGCALWHPSGRARAELRTYSATGNLLSKTPRSITDAVTTAASKTITSASAAFVDAVQGDRKQPLGIPGNGGPIVPGSIIDSVDSATSIQSSLPALTTGSGQSLDLGQGLGVGPTQGFKANQNLTFLWWNSPAFVWIMSDDQVLGEVDLSRIPNYSYNSPVACQWQIIAKTAKAYSMSWKQARVTLAHN